MVFNIHFSRNSPLEFLVSYRFHIAMSILYLPIDTVRFSVSTFSRNLVSVFPMPVLILITDAAPIRWSATTASPSLHSPLAVADFKAASKITSVDSASVALAEPSARSGTNPLYTRLCLAGASSLQVQSNESVDKTGTTTDKIGTAGLYFATNFAVLPPLVRTTMSLARALLAVLTADDASDSNGLIGNGVDLIISLKMTP
ncbi:hypothetical protein HanPI659440_Chr15g0593471 [Helianthus annuus]|nr:hypothetical protein HanPI659440_Chr15g0593471 [Helianthus annuus]